MAKATIAWERRLWAVKGAILAAFVLGAWSAGSFAWADSPQQSSGSIAWGPQVARSGLSAVAGARDDIGPGFGEALARAARAAPNGASQSSFVNDSGRTASQVSVAVIRDEAGNLVYEVSDGSFAKRAPGHGGAVRLALFAAVPAYIEPDPSSYPHDLLGLWSHDGELGAFWTRSPAPPPALDVRGLRAQEIVYRGDAVGLHMAGETATQFVAQVELAADFGAQTLGGTLSGLRTFSGDALGGAPITLGEVRIAMSGEPLAGETSARIDGRGSWGLRWAGADGSAMGGTFGFAADDGSLALLGAFRANSSAGRRGATNKPGSRDHDAVARRRPR
ncbi:hypothetical protein [Candidatus Foliamicus sp.]